MSPMKPVKIARKRDVRKALETAAAYECDFKGSLGPCNEWFGGDIAVYCGSCIAREAVAYIRDYEERASA